MPDVIRFLFQTMNEMSWNLFLLFRYSGWIFLLLLLLLLLPGIWFNIIKIVKRIPRISISLVLIHYHVLEAGTARANVESELKDSAVNHYSTFLHCLKSYDFLMLDNRHLKVKIIPSPSRGRILRKCLHFEGIWDAVGMSVCPKTIISFICYLGRFENRKR